jgi:hypothetical protein
MNLSKFFDELTRRNVWIKKFEERPDIASRYPFQKSRRIQGTLRLLLVISQAA